MNKYFFCAALLFVLMSSGDLSAVDRHANYYYPPPTAIEEIDSNARRLTQSNRRMRIGFVVGLVDQMRARPYAPTESVFVKGSQAEKLIVVANGPGRLDTLFRVRAFLATMTSVARASPMFTDLQVEDVYTFIDLLKMLGFKQITLSDGDAYSHQIIIK
jgi:hypothetical protein